MLRKLLNDKIALICMTVILLTVLAGIFAEQIAPNDPLKINIVGKYQSPSEEYPLGTDHLGRCILSRLLFGIRPTVFLSMFAMVATISLGTLVGVIAGYTRGVVDEVIMRIVDVMLSFPSQVMILAIVGMLGAGIENVIIASIIAKWAWYARMIRSNVIQYNHRNYMYYSRAIGNSNGFILRKHVVPNIMSDVVVFATLDMGWVIISISVLSFLGLGVQAPTPEWGAMLSEAKNVITTQPGQMLAPGLAISILVASFNMLGDSLRDALDPKEV